jgi:hypothetical protein
MSIIPLLEDTLNEWRFLQSNNSSHRTRVISDHPSSTSHRKQEDGGLGEKNSQLALVLPSNIVRQLVPVTGDTAGHQHLTKQNLEY